LTRFIKKHKPWLQKNLPIAAAFVLGATFVFAGALKVFDPFSFYSQIRGYRLVSAEIAKLAAFVLPPIEIGLGLAAMVGAYRRLACLALTGMLLVFMAATAHAWITGSTDNCGCFGELVSRTPKETFYEDSVLLLLAVGGMFSDKVHWQKIGRLRISNLHKVAAVLAVTGLSFVGSYRYGALDIATSGKLRAGLDASEWPISELDTRSYKKQGIDLNLKKGTHVLVFYSPLCKHCYKSIPLVEGYRKLERVDTVAGLSHDRHRTEFHDFFIRGMRDKSADYPLLTMPYEFYRTLNRSVPKTVVIETGVVRMVIPGVPTARQLAPYLN
jgi:uncharacterized membrane protein YphA (DoxX/SURF4 family)